MHVNVSGFHETTVKIRWIGPDQQLITDDRSQRVHIESSGQHGLKLKVMNATVNDDGEYKCTLGSTDDKSPREQIGFKLSVYKRTSFANTQHQVVLPVDKPGTLTCHVEFDQKVVSVEVSWLRNGKPIDMFNDSSYKVLDYDQSKQTSQLLISPVKRHHEGHYTCSASAQTPSLSKISEHHIYLETHYAPIFDSSSQTVWVERSPSIGSHARFQSSPSGLQQQQVNSYGQSTMGRARSRHGKPHYSSLDHQSNVADYSETNSTGQPGSSNTSSTIRVELRCICRANPPASIVWTQNSQKFVLEKGASPQVVDGPNTEVNGHNTTSVLVVNYSLDSDYQYKSEYYTCSASNMLGNAAKTFKIEQGDPPPAFQVDPVTYDSSRGSRLGFRLIGPVLDGAQHPPRTLANIVPPIDMLRVRVDNIEENRQPGSSKFRNHPHNHQQATVIGGSSNLNAGSPSVELPIRDSNAPSSDIFSLPRNFTVDVSRLPKGKQRLILEAHNSVGWSPNSTYLGDFYIVNGAACLTQNLLLPMVLACLVSLFSVFSRIPSVSVNLAHK